MLIRQSRRAADQSLPVAKLVKSFGGQPRVLVTSATVGRKSSAARLIPVLMLLAATVHVYAQEKKPTAARDMREILGVTHVGGKYHLTDQPFLKEGADQIADLGAGVIKLYLMLPPRQYPFNTDWPDCKSLVDLACTPAYQAVFAGPFSTYILTTYSVGRGDHYWIKEISEADAQDEADQFYRLARHLLTQYCGTDKTFVLQHWEGDWAARGSFDRNADPTERAFSGMIRWLGARQAGVDRARAEVGQDRVRVLHAAEVNLVRIALQEGRPTVTDHVLPHTNVDLVSYSAWDTQDNPQLLRQALDYIARHTPDREPFGKRNVYIGEFGLPENERSAEQIQRVIPGAIDTAVDWGCPYVVYWQLYCNEARQQPVRTNDDVRGFWLIRPDGTKAWVWQEFQRRLGKAGTKQMGN